MRKLGSKSKLRNFKKKFEASIKTNMTTHISGLSPECSDCSLRLIKKCLVEKLKKKKQEERFFPFDFLILPSAYKP